MYLTGYFERMGTGTSDMIRLSRNAHLREPDFLLEDGFKSVIWRPLNENPFYSGGEATGEVSEEVISRLQSYPQ